jgi:HSP20 family molecular chaperone IbpA
MKLQSPLQRRKATIPVKLVAADVLLNRKNEIQNAIARRAYELFEGHGRTNGHDIDDWIEAKVEVVRAYRHDLKESAGAIVFEAELPCSFTTDQLHVSVEPRRLMLSGETELDVIRGGDTPAHTEKRTQRIFGVEELPVDVDPSQAAANLKGDLLEVVMPRVAVDNKPNGKSKAASSGR